ncbi:short-chain dehydrogenase [Streptomyces sp. WAC 06738]|uniref:SDR family oxidoreductase n=1 Tax=Streptomyces sp. WAC 06738 TaxID=2203210 RepID=UPI000F6DD196|nr:SDR family oxidoreductase [Streptomyces sp. WAC 06738]AZM45794.1 short-chain dehydrogenase [Streptomyces sp. WAC 06738]
MTFAGQRVVITGASRDFGRTLAIRFAQRGAEVFVSSRSLAASRRVADEIRDLGHTQVHALVCDLADPASVRRFAADVVQRTDRVDVLVNNGARWLGGPDLLSASDEDVIDTVAAGATGTILVVKRLLPLLLASDRPDIVNVISAAGLPAHQRSDAHDAFYAAKSAQAGFADILSTRLRPRGVRVISLYPPDFSNPDPLSPEWESTPRGPGDMLTAHSVAECVFFALGQPRDCFIKAFHFEQASA